jgi:lipopolysaccharide export system ATP-binding protein
MSELIVENLRKQYKARTVVQDISLEIKSGEVIGLLGPNGAGKTTSCVHAWGFPTCRRNLPSSAR